MPLCYIFLLIVVSNSMAAVSKESGPYKIIIVDVNNPCNRTTKPFVKVSSVTSHFWLHNNSLIEGNVTLKRDLKNLKGIISLYQEENGRWSLSNRYEKIECKSFLMSTIMKLCGYKPWKDFCLIPKGTYFIRNMDANQAYHLWKKEMEYGKIVRRIELVTGSKTVFCFEAIISVVPETAHRGPYQIIMLDVSDRCNRTTKPYERMATVTSHFWTYNTTDNTSLVGGNVTLLQDQKNLMGIIKIYNVEDGSRKLEQILDKVDCKSFVMSTVMKLWGYKSWKNYCTIPKGTYNISMDYNKAFHLWKKEIKYGVMVVKLELVKGSKTVFCLKNDLMVMPDTQRKIVAARRMKRPLPSV